MKSSRQPSNYFYEVWFDDSNPLAMMSRDEDLKGVDRWIVYSGVRVEHWPANVTFYVEGKLPEDYLFSALHGWVLVSDRARSEIEKCVDTTNVQFLPVCVVRKESSEEIGRYWLLHTLSLVDALDWERTTWFHPERKYEGEYPALDIVQVALNAEALEGIDIFRLRVKGVVKGLYFSERIKQCLERAGTTTGFRFLPTPAYSQHL
jgi:hypothetical protein